MLDEGESHAGWFFLSGVHFTSGPLKVVFVAGHLRVAISMVLNINLLWCKSVVFYSDSHQPPKLHVCLYLYPRLVERKSQVFLLIFSWPTLISFMKRICSRGKISPWFVPKTSCPWSHDQARNKPIPLLVSIPYMPPNIGLFVGFCGSTKIISTNLGWEGRFPGGAGVQAINLLVFSNGGRQQRADVRQTVINTRELAASSAISDFCATSKVTVCWNHGKLVQKAWQLNQNHVLSLHQGVWINHTC